MFSTKAIIIICRDKSAKGWQPLPQLKIHHNMFGFANIVTFKFDKMYIHPFNLKI